MLECVAEGSPVHGAVLSYKWIKDGAPIDTGSRLSIMRSGALFIRAAKRSDAGTYQCIVTQEDKDLPTEIPRVNIVLDVLCEYQN